MLQIRMRKTGNEFILFAVKLILVRGKIIIDCKYYKNGVYAFINKCDIEFIKGIKFNLYNFVKISLQDGESTESPQGEIRPRWPGTLHKKTLNKMADKHEFLLRFC